MVEAVGVELFHSLEPATYTFYEEYEVPKVPLCRGYRTPIVHGCTRYNSTLRLLVGMLDAQIAKALCNDCSSETLP
jgi:hypothetical protein